MHNRIRVTTTEPTVVRQPDGALSVCVTGYDDEEGDEVWLQFRTNRAYIAFREHLDREEARHIATATDRYHAKVRALRSELRTIG